MKLSYTILNAGLSMTTRAAVVDGEAVTIQQERLSVEAIPDDDRCGTLTLSLPAEEADRFVEGSTLEIEISVKKGGK